MQEKRIRLASNADAEELLAIYAPYVRDTAISFECEVVSPAVFAQRIERICREYPYLVCIADDQIVGYAYARRQMARAAYEWNAELSVYLAPAFTGRGIGRALYGALMALLRLQQVHTVYGGVTLPNPASERLHLSLGFRRLGVYHRTGYKCGKWHDVAWFEKQILPYLADPLPFRPITALEPGQIDAILKDFQRRLNCETA